MSFTAYAELCLPQVAEALTHLGFPGYFWVELSWAKLLAVVLLFVPVPARLKEWTYAGFAINLASAIIAHISVGDGPEAWGWAAVTGVLWGLSYFFWRRLHATPSNAWPRSNHLLLSVAIMFPNCSRTRTGFQLPRLQLTLAQLK